MSDQQTDAMVRLLRDAPDHSMSAFLLSAKLGIPSSKVRELARAQLEGRVRLEPGGVVVLLENKATTPGPFASLFRQQAARSSRKADTAPQDRSPGSTSSGVQAGANAQGGDAARLDEALNEKRFADCLPPDLRRRLNW